MPGTYSITRMTEEPFLDNGKAAARVLVEFKVGTDGPFFERFPKEGFNAAVVQARLAQFATHLVQLRS
jgi:hypothetical protein